MAIMQCVRTYNVMSQLVRTRVPWYVRIRYVPWYTCTTMVRTMVRTRVYHGTRVRTRGPIWYKMVPLGTMVRTRMLLASLVPVAS